MIGRALRWCVRVTWGRGVLLLLVVGLMLTGALASTSPGDWSDSITPRVASQCLADAPLSVANISWDACDCVAEQLQQTHDARALETLSADQLQAAAAPCLAAGEGGGRWSDAERAQLLQHLGRAGTPELARCLSRSLEAQADFEGLLQLPEQALQEQLRSCRLAHPLPAPM